MEEVLHPHILYGLAPREALREKLTLSVRAFPVVPMLVIIQVGDREDSNIYIKQKINFGKSIGVEVIHKKFAETITYKELEEEIKTLNVHPEVTAIVIQLPLPPHIHRSIVECVYPEKDVDCLTTYHKNHAQNGNLYCSPATAKAVVTLLEYYSIPIVHKHVVVVGRSVLAGGPIAELCKVHGAHISVIHSKTENPKEISRTADILVVACGVPELVTSEWVDPIRHTVVIDVGIHRIGKKIVGDVNMDEISSSVSAISPVPGGVGLLTVACLFEQLVYLTERYAILDSLTNN